MVNCPCAFVGKQCAKNVSDHMLLEPRMFLWFVQMLGRLYVLGSRTLLCFGHGCSGDRMLLQREPYHVLGMDAVVSVCSWNTNLIVLRA